MFVAEVLDTEPLVSGVVVLVDGGPASERDGEQGGAEDELSHGEDMLRWTVRALPLRTISERSVRYERFARQPSSVAGR